MEILSDATFKGNLKVEGSLIVASDVRMDSKANGDRVIYYNRGTVINTTEIIFDSMIDTFNPSNNIRASDLFSKLKKIDTNGCAICSLQSDLNYINCKIGEISGIGRYMSYSGNLYFCAVPSDCTRFKINTNSTMNIDMDVEMYIRSIQLYRAYPDASHTTHLKSICMDIELPRIGCEIIFNKPSGEAFDNSEIVAKVVYNNRFGISGAISDEDWPSLPDGWFG